MRISIIIPVYNCENFISKCIESIREQTYGNWELILVDDGSTDKSLQICESYSNIDNRINVYSQHNSGPSTARNKGLSLATGTHCLFIDSDDWLEFNALEILKNKIMLNKSDIIIFSYYHDIFKKNKRLLSHVRLLENKVYLSNSEFCNDIVYYASNGALNPVWNKLYDMQFVRYTESIFPDDVKYSEDLVFNLKLYQNAEKIETIDKPLYHYVSQDKQSLSIAFNKKRFEELKKVYSLLFQLIEKRCPENINYFYNCLIHEVSVFINSIFNYKRGCSLKESLEIISNITNDLWLQNIIKIIKFNNTRNKFFGCLIKYKLNFILYLSGKLIRIVRPIE